MSLFEKEVFEAVRHPLSLVAYALGILFLFTAPRARRTSHPWLAPSFVAISMVVIISGLALQFYSPVATAPVSNPAVVSEKPTAPQASPALERGVAGSRSGSPEATPPPTAVGREGGSVSGTTFGAGGAVVGYNPGTINIVVSEASGGNAWATAIVMILVVVITGGVGLLVFMFRSRMVTRK